MSRDKRDVYYQSLPKSKSNLDHLPSYSNYIIDDANQPSSIDNRPIGTISTTNSLVNNIENYKFFENLPQQYEITIH